MPETKLFVVGVVIEHAKTTLVYDVCAQPATNREVAELAVIEALQEDFRRERGWHEGKDYKIVDYTAKEIDRAWLALFLAMTATADSREKT